MKNHDADMIVARRSDVRSTRSIMGGLGFAIVAIMLVACVGSLPYTLGREGPTSSLRRFEAIDAEQAMLPPWWAPHAPDEQARVDALVEARNGRAPRPWLGTDQLGRSVLVRCLLGGAISLGIGLSAAGLAVLIGTLYGTAAGWSGGRIDAAMMRIVDVLFGLPSILLVVLLAVAVDGLVSANTQTANAAAHAVAADASNAAGESWLAHINRNLLNIITMLVAIGGVSWLTMARVIRGQTLSLKQQPFMEACRAIGVPLPRQFIRHLLPNLLGPIIVYATLTVPAAILSESFLSFLGIGVQEPLPSWGNLAAAGLSELNTVRVRWWLLLWPCLFIGITLLALNFMGEGLRERFDPKRAS